jgi:hypothetical protein
MAAGANRTFRRRLRERRGDAGQHRRRERRARGAPDDFLNPALVPTGITDLPGSYSRAGFDDEAAIAGDWFVATLQLAAPPDCSTWGIEGSIAWNQMGREVAAPNPAVLNDPVAGFDGTDSFKLEACRPFDGHSLQIDGEWQQFQSLNTQTMIGQGETLEIRFFIPPRQNYGITDFRLIGFGFDFENARTNPETSTSPRSISRPIRFRASNGTISL